MRCRLLMTRQYGEQNLSKFRYNIFDTEETPQSFFILKYFREFETTYIYTVRKYFSI